MDWDEMDEITLDDLSAELHPLILSTDDIVTIDDDSSSFIGSSENDFDAPDQLYCVNELKNKPSRPKSRLENDKNSDFDPEALQNPPGPQNGRHGSRKKPWECPICLESAKGQEISATHCGHIFCKDCIEIHLGTSSTCPTCRRPLNKQNLITLYDM